MWSSKNISWIFRNYQKKKLMDWIWIHRLWYPVAVMFFPYALMSISERELIDCQWKNMEMKHKIPMKETRPLRCYLHSKKEWKVMFPYTLLLLSASLNTFFSKVTRRNEERHRENSYFQKHIGLNGSRFCLRRFSRVGRLLRQTEHHKESVSINGELRNDLNWMKITFVSCFWHLKKGFAK